MSQLKFIDSNLYSLERDYGVSATLGFASSSTNLATGQKTQFTNELPIPRAIQMPTNVMFEFLKAIGIIPQQQGMDALTSTIQLVVRRKYVPFAFPIEPGRTYAILNGQKHDLVKSQTFQYSIILWLKAVQQVVRPVNALNQIVTFSDRLTEA